jgi:DMSO/TMAO reductase YedYZ molybdopterin-dependent catalytic subunit
MTNRHKELTLPEQEAQQRLKRMTRRGFLVGGVAAVAGVAGYRSLTGSGQIGEISWPQRDVLDFNGKLSKAYLSDSRMVPTYQPSKIGYLKPNGGEGLDIDNPDANRNWKLVFDPGAGIKPIELQMSDLTSLPNVQLITNFCCIEGWNVITKWTGVRLSDFFKKYIPAGRALPNYVYMATPGEDYYVGLDMKSAIHPQTLLAWELNDKPLTRDHGAPLRLSIPVKYGIKNIKRIGLIRLTDQQPDDYWAENGYDWFAGL